ncbi:hypothetical protein H4R19_006076 [Coemansia spiralis]|nr:hypothetical protein H4R19_006076 [Coemansia spiralis]
MHANVSLCAVRCLTQLALKLRRAFGPFVPDTLPALIGRFRVRKPAITSATRDAVDACFAAAGCDMAAIDTALAVGASHRCPQVRAETHRALHRRLAAAPMQLAAHCTETCAPLLAAALDDSDGAVRDAAAECIATLRKLAPEHNWAVYTQHIAKAKMRKINVFAGEATPPLVCASRA